MRASAVLGIVALLVSGCATAAPSSPPQATPSLASGMKVDIGGRGLWIRCVGTGSPTVILEAGMTGDHRTWDDVIPGISTQTRVCTYDRANIQPSDPAPKPRSASLAVQDLHALLGAAGIGPPYVLVGFSLGGIIAQLYAATYPSDIKGLVLVASNHPREDVEFNKHLTQTQIDEDRTATLDNFEGFDPFKSFEEARSAGPLPKVPFVVVSSGVSDPDVWPPGWDPKIFDALSDQLQEDLVTLIPGGRHVVAEQTGHDIPEERPGIVIDAIRSVLQGG
jgi:pimeloyl-ACP methyl ester carboxylesterase